QEDTRWRMLVTSLPLIAQSPVWGHGIGSFQYLIPQAQGEYFTTHPDTGLIATQKRSDLAHDDYLQLAVELGLGGLALALGCAWLYVRKGMKAFARLTEKRDRALALAMAFGALSLALHAVMDFPFHVAPNALLFLVFMACWSSLDQLAETRGKEREEVTQREAGGTAMRLFVLCLGAAALGVSGHIQWFIGQEYYTDRLYSDADSWIRTYYEKAGLSPREKMDCLNNAELDLKRVLVAEPLNAQARFLLGETYYDRGAMWADLIRKTDYSKNPPLYRSDFAQAIKNLNLAINNITEAHKEYRYHLTLYILGLAHLERYRLDPEKNSADRTAAKENLRLSARYSPAFPQAAHHLAELLLTEPNPPYEEIRRLRRQIAEYDPRFFQQFYVGRVMELAAEGDYEAAALATRNLLSVEPDNGQYYLYLALCYVRTGKKDEAAQTLAQAEKLKEPPVLLDQYRAMLAAQEGDWQKTYEAARRLYDKDVQEDMKISLAPYVRLALERMGRKEEGEKFWSEAIKTPKDQRLGASAMGLALWLDFGDREEAMRYFREREKFEPLAEPGVYVLMAQYELDKGNLDAAREYCNKALKSAEGYKPALKLIKRIEAKKRNSQDRQDGQDN
ncbi:MAG: tetratricopeptide repeat protein, partial [bacterium]